MSDRVSQVQIQWSNEVKQQSGNTGYDKSQENSGISRRQLLKYTCSCVGAAALVSLSGLDALAAGGAMPRKKQTGLPQEGDVLVYADDKRKGELVKVEDLTIDGPPVLVFPKDPTKGEVRNDENSKIFLFRTSPDKISPELRDNAVEGVIAYSALCTHLGCVLTNWDSEQKRFVCPCHEANFDALTGKVVSGPGPRSLPVLPIKLEDSKFVVTDDFSGWVGAKENG